MDIKYTVDLQKVLDVAKTFSFENNVNSTQLLVALATCRNTFSYEILSRLGFDSKTAKSYLIATTVIDREDKFFDLIMEYAKKVAKFSGLGEVDTHHILLAICYYRESPPCKILSRHGIDYNDILPIINGMNYHAIYSNSQSNKEKSVAKINYDTEVSYSKKLPQILLDNGYDLTLRAAEKRLPPIVGRENEIDRIVRILSRKTKNNPLLIGESGVGKTAVIEGLCQRMVEEKVPDFLKKKTVYALNVNSVVAGTRYRGELEEKIKEIINSVISEKLILFIDEMQTITNAGSSENGLNISNILKPYLTGDDLCVIGTTTLAEYRLTIEKDKALSRRFMVVNIEEPNLIDSYKILAKVKISLENYHKVKLENETVKLAVDLSSRYITDRFLPDKAIDLLDEACAKKRNQNMNGDNITVTAEDIYKIVSEITKIPVGQLDTEEKWRLESIENLLNKEIIGQGQAVSKLVKAIKRGRAGVATATKPIGSFIFLGATGVGKTATAKALAKFLFGSENALIRFDMSEYMEKNSVNKLIGAPPGYVGYDEGGALTEQIKRKPYSIVLFDEIEKAHLEVYNVLLQVLDDGRLTDSYGQTVNFRNCIIIMTSNIGIKELNDRKSVGFGRNDEKSNINDYKAFENDIKKSLEEKLSPEFLNRIDSVIVFKYLDKENLKDIAKLFIERLSENVYESRKITLKVGQPTVDYLADMSYNMKYGARPLKRAIQDTLEDQLSDMILTNDLHDVTVEVNINSDNQLDFLIEKGGQNAYRNNEQKLLPG